MSSGWGTSATRSISSGTRVTLVQDGNASAEAAEHSTANWQTMLEGLKKAAERD